MARNGLAHCEPYLWDGKYLVFNGRMIHRMVWESNNGEIPFGYLVHHKNGNRLDNRLDNLEIMSQAEHCQLHRPRLGYRAPSVPGVCKKCGRIRSEQDLRNNPHRHECSRCRSKSYRQRRKESYVPAI